jgi:hypothetical protein
VPWVLSLYGLRAWLRGDMTAVRLIDESRRDVQDEWHHVPWWGVGALLQVVAGIDAEEAFGSLVLIGHQPTARHAAMERPFWSPDTANPPQSRSPKPITSSVIRRSGTTCCARSSHRLASKPDWRRQPRAGYECRCILRCCR